MFLNCLCESLACALCSQVWFCCRSLAHWPRVYRSITGCGAPSDGCTTPPTTITPKPRRWTSAEHPVVHWKPEDLPLSRAPTDNFVRNLKNRNHAWLFLGLLNASACEFLLNESKLSNMDTVSLNTSLFSGSQRISTDSPHLSMRSVSFINDTDSSRSSTLLHWNFFLAANYISVGESSLFSWRKKGPILTY